MRDVTLGLRALSTLPERLAMLQPDRLRAIIAAAVPEMVRGDLVIHDCEPRHFRRKADCWTFECAVTVGDRAGGRHEVWVDGRVGSPVATGETAWEHRGAFGSQGWRCLVPELGLELQTAPADERVPLMAALTDAERARPLLEDAIRLGSPRLAGLRIAAVRPRLMRYARGSRCTVLFELDLPADAAGRDWPAVVVAKSYRDERGEIAYRGMCALWGSELSGSPAVAIAEPLAYLPDLRLLVQGPVAEERILKQLLTSWVLQRTPDALAELTRYVAMAAEGLAALHGSGVAAGEVLTLESEIADVRSQFDRLSARIPELAGAATPLLDLIADLGARQGADPVRPSHGTFRPAQVLIHQGGIGFIDFDSFCQAEPAHDIARFRAAVKDWGMRTHLEAGGDIAPSPETTAATLAALEAVCDGFLRRYAALAPVRRERVVLWETLDMLTYVVHAWTRFSPSRLSAEMLTLGGHLSSGGLADRPFRAA